MKRLGLNVVSHVKGTLTLMQFKNIVNYIKVSKGVACLTIVVSLHRKGTNEIVGQIALPDEG